MKKFFKGFLLGLLLSVSFGSLAIIGGGVFVHNHSGNSTGGATLNSTTLNNPTLSSPTFTGGISATTFTSTVTGTGAFVASGAITNDGIIIGSGRVSDALIVANLSSGAAPLMRLDNAGVNKFSINADGTVFTTKPCAANYTRIGPNFCLRTAGAGGLTAVSGCTAIADPSGVAIALLVQLDNRVVSVNAIGTDSTNINIFNDGTCTTAIVQYSNSVREFVATAATVINEQQVYASIPVVAGNGRVTVTGTAGAAANYNIVGYFD